MVQALVYQKIKRLFLRENVEVSLWYLVMCTMVVLPLQLFVLLPVVGVVVTVLVLGVSVLVLLCHRDERALLTPVSVLVLLIVLQFTLGIVTILKRKPADIASAHVAVGALTLVTTFIVVVRAIRLLAKKQM